MKNILFLTLASSMLATSCIIVKTGEGVDLTGLKELRGFTLDSSTDLHQDSVGVYTQNVAPFSKITVDAPFHVVIKPAQVQKVEITTNLPHQYILSETENGVLTLSYNHLRGMFRNLYTSVVIYTPNFAALRVNTASDIMIKDGFSLHSLKLSLTSASKVSGKFKVGQLTVESSSASKCNLDIDAQEVIVESSSASKVQLSGNASKVNVVASSASKIELADLICKKITTKTSSAARINVSQ